MRKSEIINTLIRTKGLTRYLEVATPLTGHFFREVDASLLEMKHRLMTRCRDQFQDGGEITYRTGQNSVDDIFRQIRSLQIGYDIIFVDPYHSYEESWQAISAAFNEVKLGGYVVVHDCNPPNEITARAVASGKLWCGHTYLAFIDFVTRTVPCDYFTVDADFGCGIIRKLTRDTLFSETSIFRPRNIIRCWQRRRLAHQWNQRPLEDQSSAYRFFDEDRALYLNLTAPENFEAKAQVLPW